MLAWHLGFGGYLCTPYAEPVAAMPLGRSTFQKLNVASCCSSDGTYSRIECLDGR
jgi:hypothetical protein